MFSHLFFPFFNLLRLLLVLRLCAKGDRGNRAALTRSLSPSPASSSWLPLRCSPRQGNSGRQTERRAHGAELFLPAVDRGKQALRCAPPQARRRLLPRAPLKECCELIQLQFCQWCLKLILQTRLLFVGEKVYKDLFDCCQISSWLKMFQAPTHLFLQPLNPESTSVASYWTAIEQNIK